VLQVAGGAARGELVVRLNHVEHVPGEPCTATPLDGQLLAVLHETVMEAFSPKSESEKQYPTSALGKHFMSDVVKTLARMEFPEVS
jgi:hypothetical protein